MAKQKLDELISESEDALKKGESLDKFEVEHHGKVKDSQPKQKGKVAEKIKKEKQEAIKTDETEDVKEVGDIEEKKKEGKDKKESKTKTARPKKGKTKIRSKKYKQVKELVDAKQKYNMDEAIELVKKTSMTKFDGNVEVHVRLLGKTGKPESVRGLLQYPYTTGKKTSVIILNDKIIEEIQKTGKAGADIYLTTPQDMPKVGKLAKILGPKGKMPNPKAGTISDNPEKTKKDLEAGQTEYKTDKYGIIHQIIGKVSGKKEELAENFKALISLLPKEKIASISISATMGPGIKVILTK